MTGDLDTTAVIDAILPALHADTRANLYWWTEADLIQWMDEAVKRLARKAAVFVERSASTLSIASEALYGLPPRHVATLHVSYIDTALRPASTMQLEGLDPGYASTAGSPERWYQDLQSDLNMGLAPVPTTGGDAIPIIYAAWPPALDTAKLNTLLTAPAPLQGYLELAVLGEAYGRESEAEMPDVAQHCKARLALYESMMVQYFGPAT